MGKKLTGDAVATNLRRMIGQENVTCSDFARSIGIAPAALNQILNGMTNPSLATLLKVANKKKVSLDWLCTQDDE